MITIKRLLKVIVFTFIIMSIFTNPGCTSTVEYKKITPSQAKDMIDNGGVIILDVREQYEYDEEHIENAILLPSGQIESRAEIVLPDKNSTILVYCRSGNRSKTAASLLISLGYKNVYDFGGIIDWPFETIKSN